MGVIIITSILSTYYIAQEYTEPDVVIVLVSFLTIFLLTITQVVVSAFEKVVYSRVRETAQSKEVLELRDQFVHFAVHDLASAATAIKWGLRTIEPSTGALTPEEKEVFGNIRDRNERLIELARQILLITRIESGHLEVTMSETELRPIVAKGLEDIARVLKEKNITVNYVQPKESVILRSDPVLLEEIFRILLINSITHTNPEQGRVRVSILDGIHEAVVTVENNGQAINEETQAHVFEKLWRKEDSQGKEIAGTSFGLYIVKCLTEVLGGTINFTTKSEQTSFIVAFPKNKGGAIS
jgi:two-component system sensor histidine kinase MtrB